MAVLIQEHQTYIEGVGKKWVAALGLWSDAAEADWPSSVLGDAPKKKHGRLNAPFQATSHTPVPVASMPGDLSMAFDAVRKDQEEERQQLEEQAVQDELDGGEVELELDEEQVLFFSSDPMQGDDQEVERLLFTSIVGLEYGT